MNRRFRILLLALCLLLSACSPRTQPSDPAESEDFSVYASFYPIYALTDMLLEGVNGVKLHCLVQPQDGCLRSYQLSDWDLALLTGSADAVITGGRGLESFETLLYSLGESGPAVSTVFHDMELINLPAVNTDADTNSHWLTDNPHIYMDADAAQQIAERIAASLSVLDSEHESQYAENLKTAIEKLSALQKEIDGALAHLKGKKAIVMNEALIYAAQCYGLEIDLCYERENGADLAGADLENCLQALQKSDAGLILLEKQAPQQLVRALQGAGYHVAALDTLSTRRADEGSEGYFAAHRANIQAILAALSADA